MTAKPKYFSPIDVSQNSDYNRVRMSIVHSSYVLPPNFAVIPECDFTCQVDVDEGSIECTPPPNSVYKA